jgi:hypothetical protein
MYTNTFGHNECVVGINSPARFIISLHQRRFEHMDTIEFYFQKPCHRLSSVDRFLWSTILLRFRYLYLTDLYNTSNLTLFLEPCAQCTIHAKKI